MLEYVAPSKEARVECCSFFQISEKYDQSDYFFSDCGSAKPLNWKEPEDGWNAACYAEQGIFFSEANADVECYHLLATNDFEGNSVAAPLWTLNSFEERQKDEIITQEQILTNGFSCTPSKSILTRGRLKESLQKHPRGTSSFIHKRNERERERVRCVNEGYADLRQKLPLKFKNEKKISKVETLRYAITYIKHLQNLINQSDSTQCGRL